MVAMVYIQALMDFNRFQLLNILLKYPYYNWVSSNININIILGNILPYLYILFYIIYLAGILDTYLLIYFT